MKRLMECLLLAAIFYYSHFTLAFPKRPILHVQVISVQGEVEGYKGWTKNEIDREIHEARQVFQQCGINIHFNLSEIRLGQFQPAQDYSSYIDGFASLKLEEFNHLRPNNEPVILLVHRFMPESYIINAWGWDAFSVRASMGYSLNLDGYNSVIKRAHIPKEILNVAVVNRWALEQSHHTFSHELGHILLNETGHYRITPRDNFPGNLMVSGFTMGQSQFPSTHLTEEQCSQIRANILSQFGIRK